MSVDALAGKRIAPHAYEALAEALAVIHWNEQPFERYIRSSLRDYPEIIARLDFSQTKRQVAGAVVTLLQGQAAYQTAALTLMTEIAEMRTFPNLARQGDAEERIAIARDAVKVLAVITETYRRTFHTTERLRALQEAAERQAEALRVHTRALTEIKRDFLDLHTMADKHRRGRRLEGLLHRLFEIHDMEPRLSYSLASEQIDGSVTFDTDDYLLEAKWWKQPVDRAEADIFAAKISRKGRNTLGIFVSINGFTEGFRSVLHPGGTPFVTFDGDDLFHVLDSRVDLGELLRRKRRHLNDTGSCWLPTREAMIIS
ncbi:restriction endonuclease [Micromonospora sp. URMC 103]|uniref:restriction endonuclease n=1 Tax=Micromonospora sp. URMC 103 TaxID=3423406 RepID=UPI003F1DF4B4